MRRGCKILCLAGALGLASGLVVAQYRSGRDADFRSAEMPTWKNEPGFEKDVFTFIRVRYSSGWNGSSSSGGWRTDFPDSDWNFSFRLQQMTSLKVQPGGRILELTDKELFDFPFIYMIEPGRLTFSEEEVACLRRYLLNGGFMMVDDFWGELQWSNFYREIKRVFPDREPQDLGLDHPIFHSVFDLKEKPQVNAIGWAIRGRPYGITWERHDGEECREVHYRAIHDDRGRMCVMICHNTDLGDGWEQEGEDEWFFREFSEKKGYPMGINIVFYAMTH